MTSTIDLNANKWRDNDETEDEDENENPNRKRSEPEELLDIKKSENDEELKILKKPKRSLRPKFDENILLCPQGLEKIYKDFPKSCTFNGRGKEATDLHNLINSYKRWSYELCSMNFDDVLSNIEKLGSKGMVRSSMEKMREIERKRYMVSTLGIKPVEKIVLESSTNTTSQAQASSLYSSLVTSKTNTMFPVMPSSTTNQSTTATTSTDYITTKETVAISNYESHQLNHPSTNNISHRNNVVDNIIGPPSVTLEVSTASQFDTPLHAVATPGSCGRVIHDGYLVTGIRDSLVHSQHDTPFADIPAKSSRTSRGVSEGRLTSVETPDFEDDGDEVAVPGGGVVVEHRHEDISLEEGSSDAPTIAITAPSTHTVSESVSTVFQAEESKNSTTGQTRGRLVSKSGIPSAATIVSASDDSDDELEFE